MELEQLRIFVAVAESGSYTKGAKLMYSSHSSCSRAVSALERELGLPLIKRSNHVLGLTAAGAALLREARELLARVDSLPDRLKAAQETQGEL